MTEALATLFEGKEIRVIEQAGDVWLPLIDLSQAWSLDRSTLFKHIERNPELFTDCTRIIDFLSKDGIEAVRCVNEEGLYLLIARISSGRLKDPSAKAAIMHFRMAAPKLIKAYRKKEIVHQPVNQDAALKASLSTARLLATETGGELAAFQKIALEKCGLGEWAPALSTVSTIVHGEPGWHNATQLGEMCGLTAEQVNAYLYNKAFQYREGRIWRLNPTGEMHGKEYIFEATSGHREIRIRWRESILYASGLKRPVDASQIALPVRA